MVLLDQPATSGKGTEMATLAARELDIPDEQDIQQAKYAAERLAEFRQEGSSLFLAWGSDDSDEGVGSLPIPDEALQPLAEILEAQSEGNAVAVMPVHTEYTTERAARILNVDHSHMLDLVDEGKISCRMVDGKQLVPLSELLESSGLDDAGKQNLLQELAMQFMTIVFEDK